MQLDKLFEWRYWKAFTEWEIWVFILNGLQITIMMAVVAIVASLILGTLLALARVSNFRVLRYPAAVYVEIIRSLPILYIIFFSYFGGSRFGLTDPVIAATIALTAYTAAINAEIIRSGIVSIERGEVEAARSLGMTYFQAMRFVILPQAFRRIIPPQVSQLVTLIKDTSLAYIVGTNELMRRIFILYSGFEVGVIQGLFVACLIYFLINYALSQLARRLELGGSGIALQVAAEAGRPAVAK